MCHLPHNIFSVAQIILASAFSRFDSFFFSRPFILAVSQIDNACIWHSIHFYQHCSNIKAANLSDNLRKMAFRTGYNQNQFGRQHKMLFRCTFSASHGSVAATNTHQNLHEYYFICLPIINRTQAFWHIFLFVLLFLLLLNESNIDGIDFQKCFLCVYTLETLHLGRNFHGINYCRITFAGYNVCWPCCGSCCSFCFTFVNTILTKIFAHFCRLKVTRLKHTSYEHCSIDCHQRLIISVWPQSLCLTTKWMYNYVQVILIALSYGKRTFSYALTIEHKTYWINTWMLLELI